MLHVLQFGGGGFGNGCGSGRRRGRLRLRNRGHYRCGRGGGTATAEGLRGRGGHERTAVDHATAIGAVFGVHRDGTTAFLTGIHFHSRGHCCDGGWTGPAPTTRRVLVSRRNGRYTARRPMTERNISRRKVSHFFEDTRRFSHKVREKTSFFGQNATSCP